MDVECEELNGSEEKNIEDAVSEESKENAEEVESKQVVPSFKHNISEDVDEKTKAEVTGTVGQQNISHKVENATEPTRTTDHGYENGKRKIKEEKPPTKVVVRRLPPLMTKETFLEQVSPLPPYDYMYFVNGDPSYGIYSFSRAYLNLLNQEDVFTFTRTFDNYVFLDAKGQEYPAIVEFAPFQRVPKQRSKKKDTLTGTIESDPMFISFKENLLAEALENSKSGAKTMKQHYFETEISTTEEINTTPLLEYLKQRRAEKARIRDERREEKKRKDAERKLKQKTKDKKVDGEEDETTKDVKIDHCTVSAEKTFKTGEFTLLSKSEKEKMISSSNKESDSINIQTRSSPKESVAISDKIIIKKRRERNINNNDFIKALTENNSSNNNTNCKNNKRSNIEHHCNKQNVPSSYHFDSETKKTSSLSDLMANNSQLRESSNTCGVKKAEQQTQYLRKILGLSSQDNHSLSNQDTEKTVHIIKPCPKSQVKSVNTLTSDNQGKSTKNQPKIIVSTPRTLWCERNINPALPSASFKTSTNLMQNKNETDSKSVCISTCLEEYKTNKKGDSNVDSTQVNRPFRGEIVIDRALSTNNVLPSAFRKTESKDTK